MKYGTAFRAKRMLLEKREAISGKSLCICQSRKHLPAVTITKQSLSRQPSNGESRRPWQDREEKETENQEGGKAKQQKAKQEEE